MESYLVCLEYGVCHDQLLDGEGVNKFLEEVVGAQPVETKAVNIPRTRLFEGLDPLFHGGSSPDQVVVEDHIPALH